MDSNFQCVIYIPSVLEENLSVRKTSRGQIFVGNAVLLDKIHCPPQNQMSCHAVGCPRRKWSGWTKHGATNGPPGPCTAAIVVPPPFHSWSLHLTWTSSTVLLWQSFLTQGIYRLQYKHPAKALSMVIMLRSYLYVLNYLAGLAGIQLHVAYFMFC